MSSPASRSSKTQYTPLIIGSIGIVMVLILGTVACLLLLSRRSQEQQNIAPIPTVTNLDTEPLPTPAAGTNSPSKISYVAQEPIKGFSDCDKFGFKGSVKTGNGTQLEGVQIVVWEETIGLLALDSTDLEGAYSITFEGSAEARKLWVQVYENDVPVSQPVLTQIQFDCQTGFQVYQIDWQQIEDN